MPMIELKELSKSYGGFTAVNRISLTVERGEIFAFLGPNGAGKTTTIRMLMGLLVPTGGTAAIDGLDCIADRVEVKRRVGYLPDNPLFYDFLTGHEVLEFLAEMHGLPRSAAQARARSLMEEFALGEASAEYAVNYSMGMKKKLALAGALIHDPPVLILDEPTNGLDPRAAHEVDERLRKSVAAGKTVFLSTHLLDRVEKLGARVGIIHAGQLVAVGHLEDLRQSFAAGGSLEEIYLKVTEPAEPPA